MSHIKIKERSSCDKDHKRTEAMTDEQSKFVIGKTLLERYDRISQTRGLSNTEKMRIDEIKKELFTLVVKYGMSLAHERMQKMRLSSDAYMEITQDLARIFYEKLDAYDPTLSTPTTYFKPYFNQVITEYLTRYSQNLKAHDAKNLGILNAAIRDYELKGIKWDEQMLSTRTGLSAKQVSKTLKFANNSIRGNIEDAAYVQSKEPTPEEHYITEERQNTIITTLMKELSHDEYDFFLTKVNLDGEKEITFQDLAKKYRIPVRDAKQKYNSIITKLSNNKDMQSYHDSYYSRKKFKKEYTKDTVTFSDNSAAIMEFQITGELRGRGQLTFGWNETEEEININIKKKVV